MDSIIDKDQRLSEGHPEAEDRKLWTLRIRLMTKRWR